MTSSDRDTRTLYLFRTFLIIVSPAPQTLQLREPDLNAEPNHPCFPCTISYRQDSSSNLPGLPSPLLCAP